MVQRYKSVYFNAHMFNSLQFRKICMTIIFVLAIYAGHVSGAAVRHRRPDRETDELPCGALEYCSVGYAVCVAVDEESSCYPCSALDSKCGTRDQMIGCHLHCRDVLRQQMSAECNKTVAGMPAAPERPDAQYSYFEWLMVSASVNAVLVILLLGIGVCYCYCRGTSNGRRGSQQSLTSGTTSDGKLTDRHSPLGDSKSTMSDEQASANQTSCSTSGNDPSATTGDPAREALLKETRESGPAEREPHYCEKKLKGVNPAQDDDGEMAIN